MKKIVLFDGDCNFCSRSVQFIIKHEDKDVFRFASLESSIGWDLRKKYSIPKEIDSLILIEKKKWWMKSSAALRICKDLKGFWKVFYLLMMIPRPIRNFIYDWIAKRRHAVFQEEEHCILPTEKEREKFLE